MDPRGRGIWRVAGLLDRYERTGYGSDLMAVDLPDDPAVPLPSLGAGDAPRNLARLRWYRYVQLPGMAGLTERRALLVVLARLDGRFGELPEQLRDFAAAARPSSRDGPVTVGPEKVDQLAFLMSRYRSSGRLDALSDGSELAVGWLGEAERPYERAALRTYLAEVSFLYGQAGAPGGYEVAERYASKAIQETQDGDPHTANRLLLKGRYAEQWDGPDGLTRAVAGYRQAAELARQRPPVDLAPMRALSAALTRRYEATGSSDALTEALAAARDLRQATAHDDPRTAEHQRRFERLRAKAHDQIGADATEELVHAGPEWLHALVATAEDGDARLADRRAAARTLAAATPASHPGRPEALLLAAQTERELCLAGADDVSLDEARELAGRAVRAAPPGDVRRRALVSLAEILLLLGQERPVDDLADEAVTVIRQARALLPENDPHSAGPLGHLADVLVEAANMMNDPTLLPEVVEIRRAAVRAAPPGADGRAFWLVNLASSLLDLARRDGDRPLWEESVSVGREAVAALPADDPRRVGPLFNLATGLSSPVDGRPELAQLREAERFLREGQALLPADHPDEPRFGSSRAWLLYLRHQATGERAPLVEAVELAREALAQTPGDAIWRPVRNDYLARSTAALYRLDGARDPALWAEAMAAFAVVVESEHYPLNPRIEAQRDRAELARSGGDPALALQALESVLDEVPRLARRSLAGAVRYGTARRLGSLAVDAAAAAIAVGRPDRAVELLERNRAVLFSEALATRRYWVPLREIDPRAAAQLEEIESQLAEADAYSHIAAISVEASVESSGQVVRRASTTTDPRPGWAAATRRLAAERESILELVANHPRFEELMRPPTLAELRRRTAGAPVVLVLADRDQGHALIVPAEPELLVRHLRLPAATQDAVGEQIRRLETAVADATDVRASFDRREAAQHELHGVLEWLWDYVTEPVLAGLAPPPAGPPPRVWWCPVGALVRLPLHAAGHHRDPGGDRTVLDRAVSSYTPTIGALALARRETGARPGGTLVVAVPETPRLPPLPQAVAEAEEVRALVPGAQVLIGADATLSAVEAGLESSSVVHFACHGDSDTGLALLRGSGLHLASGETFTSAAVHDARLEQGELAFLSACSTAGPHPDLPDEPLHLAAAFQLAGFRGVIGTMWRAPDSPRIARAVYTTLTDSGTHPPDPRLAAVALADALRAARDAYPAVPTRWAAYLHVGA